MEVNEYQKLALRTANKGGDALIVNSALGLCGESGEVADHVKKSFFQGHVLCKEQLVEELGDVAWYIATMAHALETDLETVLQKNIDKLKRRYPDGFSEELSINRKEYKNE